MKSIIIVLGRDCCAANRSSTGTHDLPVQLDSASTGSHRLEMIHGWQRMWQTGTNAGGYALNSFDPALSDAIGSPNGFTVMLDDRSFGPFLPGNSSHSERSVEPSDRRRLHLYPGLKSDIIATHPVFHCAYRRNSGCQWR